MYSNNTTLGTCISFHKQSKKQIQPCDYTVLLASTLWCLFRLRDDCGTGGGLQVAEVPFGLLLCSGVFATSVISTPLIDPAAAPLKLPLLPGQADIERSSSDATLVCLPFADNAITSQSIT